ncbi:MAG: formyl transferase [Aureispira sp.]|nr:formyl transferase [Aureispira sp.]
MTKTKKIVMLSGKDHYSLMMYNGLKDHYNIEKVIVEEAVDRKKFLKRRIKRLGYFKVFGQILFQLFIVKLLRMTSKAKIAALKEKYQLKETPIDQDKILNATSINSKASRELLEEIQPDIIIVNGTRIISKKILGCTNAIFINTHAGITPKYRGVHGGYWALAHKDKENCGVTVHLVDPGIDTGGILHQAIVEVEANDNFVTYPYIQLAKGIELMKQTLGEAIVQDKLETKEGTKESFLWYHPTIWYYLYHRVFKGVR